MDTYSYKINPQKQHRIDFSHIRLAIFVIGNHQLKAPDASQAYLHCKVIEASAGCP